MYILTLISVVVTILGIIIGIITIFGKDPKNKIKKIFSSMKTIFLNFIWFYKRRVRLRTKSKNKKIIKEIPLSKKMDIEMFQIKKLYTIKSHHRINVLSYSKNGDLEDFRDAP